jgi:L-threonylcarbamoyladenylate synthase
MGLVDLKPKTERLDARIAGNIRRAAEILRGGGTVAFPTETVYGLGANALSSEAVAKIFEAKKRPGWDPLIVHISDPEMLQRITGLRTFEDFAIESRIHPLMDAFWPGPLTLLLPRTAAVPDAVTSGRPLVGVRMPAHPVALELIRQAGVPIAAPSANLFGHTSPTTAAHVLADLDGRIDAVLDGGAAEVGVESTVLGVDRYRFVVYRPGAITIEMLNGVLGAGMAQPYVAPASEAPETLPSPGVSLRHYAPRARLVLVEAPFFPFEGPAGALIEATGEALVENPAVGVMLPDGWTTNSVPYLYRWGPWNQPEVLARRLFAGLRALDDSNADVIICPVPSGNGLAAAIRDRLQKAARTE